MALTALFLSSAACFDSGGGDRCDAGRCTLVANADPSDASEHSTPPDSSARDAGSPALDASVAGDASAIIIPLPLPDAMSPELDASPEVDASAAVDASPEVDAMPDVDATAAVDATPRPDAGPATSACTVYTQLAAGSVHGAGQVSYCVLWGGVIPVHQSPDPNSASVGTLNSANQNWFRGQVSAVRWCYPNHPEWCNPAWVYTLADNGVFGWVSEVFFQSPLSDLDPNLHVCTPTSYPELCQPF